MRPIILTIAFAISIQSASALTLLWDANPDNSPDVTYNVYQATSIAGPYLKIAEKITLTSYLLPDLGGVTYYFYVTAVDTAGMESGPSNIVCSSKELKPSNLIISAP